MLLALPCSWQPCLSPSRSPCDVFADSYNRRHRLAALFFKTLVLSSPSSNFLSWWFPLLFLFSCIAFLFVLSSPVMEPYPIFPLSIGSMMKSSQNWRYTCPPPPSLREPRRAALISLLSVFSFPAFAHRHPVPPPISNRNCFPRFASPNNSRRPRWFRLVIVFLCIRGMTVISEIANPPFPSLRPNA